MATTATMGMEMGLSRMSDEDYSSEFGTPRPGTDRQCAEISASTASTCRWIFAQVAKKSAQETKRKIVSRTYYRMAANRKVIDAIGALEKSCSLSDEMPQADFQLLKKAIERFNVQIRVFDSLPRASQQAQIMHSTAMTLCNVLSPETASRKFISLEKLTSAVRTDLVEFLTSQDRKHDRAAVVKQIKESIRKTRKASQ